MLTVREATLDDLEPLRALLNEIVRIGGTTAIEAPLSSGEFESYFLRGPDHLCCFVAIDGEHLGFQAMERRADPPEGWSEIATFTRAGMQGRGVGAALFAATRKRAGELGLVAINATIRADNAGGLAYYARMGFDDWLVAKNVPHGSSRSTDRISKRWIVRDHS